MHHRTCASSITSSALPVTTGVASYSRGSMRRTSGGALLKLLRNAPSDVRVIDHLEYDDTPVVTGNADEGSHPVPTSGRGAIHVVTDVIGATAVLHGPAGHVLNRCERS